MAGRKPTSTDLKIYRDTLRAMRRELAGDINHLEAGAFIEAGKSASPDPADNSSDSFAQEFSLELLQRDGQTLELIEAALKRLEGDAFGRCKGCEEWIKKARMVAIPFAEKCIDCQRQSELEG